MNDLLGTVLLALREGDGLPDQTLLYHLSSLDASQIERLREIWSTLPVDLRRDLMSRLKDLAEADFTLDFGAIFRVALNDEDAQVRTAAIEGLWEDHDVRLVTPLVERLREDEAVEVRAAAATSLGRFIFLGELEKIRSRPRNLAYNALLDVCQSSDEHMEVQRRALESLAYVGSKAVIALIRQAYTASEEKVRISAVFAMGRSADPRWEDQVQRELYNPNPEMRYEAAKACGELQLREAVSSLEDLTEDADAEVQSAALWALGQIDSERAREILEYYCYVENEAARAAAESALEEWEFLYGDLSALIEPIFRDVNW